MNRTPRYKLSNECLKPLKRKTIHFLRTQTCWANGKKDSYLSRFSDKKILPHKDISCPYVNSYFIIILIKNTTGFFSPKVCNGRGGVG